MGNGQNTFLWKDNWHSLGPLHLRYGDSLGHSVGRALAAKVSSIIENGCWKWPRMRSFVTQDITANTHTSLLLNTICDN